MDVNGFQSDNRCNDIMPIHSLEGVLRGFGFGIHHVDGHDQDAVLAAWESARGRLDVILADTVKGGGSQLLPSAVSPETGLLAQPWHTKVPPWPLYCDVVTEQLGVAGDAAATHAWQQHLSSTLTPEACATLPNTLRPAAGALQGTGKAFGAYLCGLLGAREDVVIVDADLATSCGLNAAVGHPRYYEVGVSEQDMVSFGAGMALAGQRPVVNTYANFFRRAYENIAIALAEGARVVYAGAYAGLCYHTDGKSHQSTNDASAMVALPGLIVMDPVTPAQTCALAEWALRPDTVSSVYFRLRRTPCPALCVVDEAAQGLYSPSVPVVVRQPDALTEPFVVFVTMGTIGTDLALRCVKEVPGFRGANIIVVPALNMPTVDEALWAGLFRSAHSVITIEDDAGALRAFVLERLAHPALPSRPQLVSKTLRGFGPSFRTLPACLEHHGYTVEAILALYLESLLPQP